MMWRAKKILLLLIMLSSYAYAEPARKLSWESVEGAAGYYIEIKDSDENSVAAETVAGNSYDILRLQPGKYQFRIATVNMLGQRGQSTDWIEFTVEKLFVPELKSVSKRQLVASAVNRNIVIHGKNFKTTSRFILRGEGREIELIDVDIKSEKEAVIAFKPEKSYQGRYDLIVINRGDVESVLKEAIVIVVPEEAESVFYLGGIYCINMPSGDFPEYIATSFIGGGVFFQVEALSLGFDNIMFEAEVDVARYVNTADTKPCSLTYITFGLGIDYLYPVQFAPVEIVLKFLAGPSYTSLVMDENRKEKEQDSIDLFCMLGAGVRYYTGGHFFIEPSFNFKTVFYAGTFFYDARVSLGCGTVF